MVLSVALRGMVSETTMVIIVIGRLDISENTTSWTTEENSFTICDKRTKAVAQKLNATYFAKDAFFNTDNMRTYTHTYVGPFHVKLGLQAVNNKKSTGFYMIYDLRMLNGSNKWYWADKALGAIGDMARSPDGETDAWFGLGG